MLFSNLDQLLLFILKEYLSMSDCTVAYKTVNICHDSNVKTEWKFFASDSNQIVQKMKVDDGVTSILIRFAALSKGFVHF